MFGGNELSKGSAFCRLMEMWCCSCFGFTTRRPRLITKPKSTVGGFGSRPSQQHLLEEEVEEEEEEDDDGFYDGEATDMTPDDDQDMANNANRGEEILMRRLQNGLICRKRLVKETQKLVRFEDENGIKNINQYVRVCKIGFGSYAKVVLYRSIVDGQQYAIKSFHKSHLLKQRVAPSETAMTDVLREVLIMKMLSHPNIVNLIEVIDDPDTDHFYMVLEYVEGKWDCEGAGPPGGLGEATARKYFRNIVSGLIYLHSHNILHMDIKPQNLLVSRTGKVKIADYSVSQVFEGDNDELRRSPGTPVITAPECCLGLTYRGRAADTWAVGVTLYCMVMGCFPFIGETLQDTYDKIVNEPLHLPDTVNPQLTNLLEGILCKDPNQRMTLDVVAQHPWVIGDEEPLPGFLCWCKRNTLQRVDFEADREASQ